MSIKTSERSVFATLHRSGGSPVGSRGLHQGYGHPEAGRSVQEPSVSAREWTLKPILDRIFFMETDVAGYYFVTVCTRDRQCLLGDVIDGAMILNDAGNIVHSTWNDLPAHYHHVRLDAMVIMPNHIHGIIVLNGFDGSNTMIDSDVGAGLKPAPAVSHCRRSGCQHPRHGLSEIIRGFKTFSARKINQHRHLNPQRIRRSPA